MDSNIAETCGSANDSDYYDLAFRDYLPSFSRNEQHEPDVDQVTDEYGNPSHGDPSYYDDDDCDDADEDEYSYYDDGYDYDYEVDEDEEEEDDDDDCDNGDDSDDGSQWNILQVPSENPSVPTPTTANAQPTGSYDPCDEEEEAPTQAPKLNESNLVMANGFPRLRMPWRRQRSQEEGAPQSPVDNGEQDGENSQDQDMDDGWENETGEDEQDRPDIIDEPVPGEIEDEPPGEIDSPALDTPSSNSTNSTLSYLMSKRVLGFSPIGPHNLTDSLKYPRDGKYNTSLSSHITEGKQSNDDDDFIVDPEEDEEDLDDDDIDFYENDDDEDLYNVDKEAQRQGPYRRRPTGDPYRRRAAVGEDNSYGRRPVERDDQYRNREREDELEREHELERQEKYRRARERENMYREREREKELEREREKQYRNDLERERDEFYRDRDAYMRDKEEKERDRQKENSNLHSSPPDTNDERNKLKYDDDDFSNDGPFDDDHSHRYVPDDEYDYDDHPDHRQNHRHHSHRSHEHRNRRQDNHHHLPIPDPHDIPIPFPNPHIPWHGHSDCGDDDSCYDDCRGDHCHQRAPDDCYDGHCNQRAPNDDYGYGRVPEYDDGDDNDGFFNGGRNLLRDDEEDRNERPSPRRDGRQMEHSDPDGRKKSRSSRPPVDCSECLAYAPDERQKEVPHRNRRIRDPQDYVRHPQNRSAGFSNYVQQKNLKNSGDGDGNQSYSGMASYINATNASNDSTLPNQQNFQTEKPVVQMNRTENKQMAADSSAHSYAQTNMVMATAVVFVLTCFAYNIIF